MERILPSEFAAQAARTMRKVYAFSEKARSEGLLALKGDIGAEGRNRENILEYGLLLAAGGVGPQALESILCGLVGAEKDRSAARLKAMQKDAALNIQKGLSFRLLLFAMLSRMRAAELKEARELLVDSGVHDELARALEKPAQDEAVVETWSADGAALESPPLCQVPFDITCGVDSDRLALLRKESPQVIAFVMGNMNPQKAAEVLESLSSDVQAEVARIIAVGTPADLQTASAVVGMKKRLSAPPDRDDFRMLLETILGSRQAVDEALRLYDEAAKTSPGSPEAAKVMNRLERLIQGRPLDFIRRHPECVTPLLRQEHPKIVALFLACLEPGEAWGFLRELPNETQRDAVLAMAAIDRDDPEIPRLEKKVSAGLGAKVEIGDGIENVVKILNIDRYASWQVIRDLEEVDGELVGKITKHSFVFDDIVILSGRDIQRVMRELDDKGLAMALKDASADVQNKIFENLSKGAVIRLKESMECVGRISRGKSDAARQEIIAIVRHLEDTGEIIIPRSGKDESVV